MMAGAVGEEVDQLAKILVEKGAVRIDVAEKELASIREK
jgi:hydroxymethylglutaryl-CoA reductase